MLDEMANKKLTYSQMHMELLTLKQKSHACFCHLEYEYLEEYRMEIRKKTFISDQTYVLHTSKGIHWIGKGSQCFT